MLRVGMNGGSGEVNVIDGGKIIVNNNNSYAYPFGIGGSGDSSGDNGSIVL